jgi:hypothetical protein
MYQQARLFDSRLHAILSNSDCYLTPRGWTHNLLAQPPDAAQLPIYTQKRLAINASSLQKLLRFHSWSFDGIDSF